MSISDSTNDIHERYKFIVDCVYNEVSYDLLRKIINNTDICSICNDIEKMDVEREKDVDVMIKDISCLESTIKDLENEINNLENNI